MHAARPPEPWVQAGSLCTWTWHLDFRVPTSALECRNTLVWKLKGPRKGRVLLGMASFSRGTAEDPFSHWRET